MLKVRVWDNGNKTMDRYTIAIYQDWADQWVIFGMSDNPNKPDGFNQYSDTLKILPYAKNDILIGNEIKFYSLNAEVIKAIALRL